MTDPAAGASGTSWPVRLLAVADLSGGRERGAGDAGPSIETLFAALRPRLVSAADLPVDLPFASLADFHPEAVRRALREGGAAPASDADLDRVLHAPRFQALEAAWRGVARLLAASRPGEITVLDVGDAALRARPEMVFEALPADPLSRPTAILLDLEIGAAPADLALLRRLAALAERHRTPLVVAAAPSLLGLRHGAHLAALPDPAERLEGAGGGSWGAFRAGDAARFVVLTAGRFLLRAPYLAGTDGHVETVSASRPETYLWGRGAWLAGADLLRSGRTHGHPLALSGLFPERFQTGLPVWGWSGAGGVRQSSSLEAALDEAAVQKYLRAGLSPLYEPAGPGTAVLPLLVNAFRPDPRRIPVEGTLAHTLVLARLVAALAAAAPAAEAEPDDGAAQGILQGSLRSALAPRLTDGDSGRLTIAVERGAGGRLARASLRGDLTGVGRIAEIDLSLPLGGGAR